MSAKRAELAASQPLCRSSDKKNPPLPRHARLPINRCNLPAAILGGLSFQDFPAPLEIDGIADLHRPLFDLLAGIADAQERAERFMGYMTAHFRLEAPEDAGLVPGTKKNRARASYLKVVRGWAFDADGREAAVLKGWVESRFGLLPLFHGGQLADEEAVEHARYLEMRSRGLYGSNALEAQLDLLYAFCQYELARRFAGRAHLTLYRGVNRLADLEIEREDDGRRILLMNNVNSFSSSRERAGEFGDVILTARVPQSKLIFFSSLLPGLLKGEEEFVVLGGLFRVRAEFL